jgi:hypothetical protein
LHIGELKVLSQRYFWRHWKISTTNIAGILHHSTRVRKQKIYKNLLCCHMCWRLAQTDTNTVFNPVPPRQSDLRVGKNVAIVKYLISGSSLATLGSEGFWC